MKILYKEGKQGLLFWLPLLTREKLGKTPSHMSMNGKGMTFTQLSPMQRDAVCRVLTSNMQASQEDFDWVPVRPGDRVPTE